MDIVIIGSGNVATSLGKKALAAGHKIVQVVSRSSLHAKILADQLACEYGGLSEINRSALIYIIAISDSALINLKQILHLNKAIVVHTAGAVSIDVLQGVSLNYGVIWPLQSLRKEAQTVPDFPLLVDGNTPECITVLQDFSSSISTRVERMNDAQRMKMHLAAVISGNFSNHLYTLVDDYCTNENLDFSLLQPMLLETVSRLSYFRPASVQTGPAVRNDIETMNHHMEMLKQNDDLSEVYEMFSSLIIKANQS